MDDVYSNEMGAKTAGLASYIFVSKIIGMLIAGLALIVVARILGPSVYGIYTEAIAVAGLFSMASDFGIGTAFNKFIAEHKTLGRIGKIDELISNGLFASLILGIVLTITALALSGILASLVLHNAAYAYVLQLAAFMVVVGMIATALNNAMVGFGKGIHFALMLMAQVVVQTIVSVSLALAGFGALAPILGLLLGGVSQIVYALYVIFFVNHVKLVMPSFEAIGSIFKFSLPIAATSALSAMVSSLAVMVLGVYATTAVVGNVGIASKVGSFVGAFAESISVSLLPAFASTIATKQKKGSLSRLYNYSIYVSLMIMIPVLLSVALLSKPFTFTAFSGEYTLAPLYVSIVGVGVLINIIAAYTSTLLISGNKVKALLRSYVVLTALQLVAMALLIPEFGGLGMVVLIYVITPIASVLLFARESSLALKVRLELDRPLRIALAGVISVLVFVPIMLLFPNNSIGLLAGIAIEQMVVYPPMLALLKGVTAKDLDGLKRMSRRLPVIGTAIALLADYSLRFARS